MKDKSDTTVVVAMSGGVDSSVAAALLHRQGYNVIGITLQLWEFAEVGGNVVRETACCSLEMMNDARAVCARLGIPHFVLDFRKKFEAEVVNYFVQEYLDGRTPNPCILCNARVKWGALLHRARELGADYLATGHYARVGYDAPRGRYVLRQGTDPSKDQSYALWALSQEQLAHTLLPLGEMRKSDVRKLAAEWGLKTAHKVESQELCFIADNDYRRFLRERTDGTLRPGEIVTTDGRVVGTHQGYPAYTVGQRKGLGVAMGKPVYVIRIEPQTNRIVIGERDELLSQGLLARQLNWIAIDELREPMQVTARIRYNDEGVPATVNPMAEGAVWVHFRSPRPAVTPGQSVVFYDGEVVVGGAVIAEDLKRKEPVHEREESHGADTA